MSAVAKPAPVLDCARLYAARGWSPVPCRPGTKFPAGEWLRYQTAVPTDAQLVDWFSAQGFTRLGIVTGQHSGIIAADFDGEVGMATLARLEAHGFPMSVRQITPRGGCHVLLKHPGFHVPTRKWLESPWRDILPGMDIRGDGGFIMAAPSSGAESGAYAWDVDAHPDEHAVANFDRPDFWELICRSTIPFGAAAPAMPVERAPGALGLPTGVITDGRESYMRDTILAVTRSLRDSLGRLPTEQEVIEEAWPQYAAKVDLTRPGRGADEFRRKVAYTLARVKAGQVRGFLADGAAETAEPQLSDKSGQQPSSTKPGIQLLDLAALDALPPPQWLVDGLIPEAGLVIPYGPPKHGKTFIVLSMSLHIAAGKPWFGREVSQGGVVYVAGEGVGGLSIRIRAMRQHYDIPANIPFWVVPRAVSFKDPQAVPNLVAAIKATVLDEPISLVVLDTLARAMPGVDENSAQEVGVIIAACDDLKAELNTTVMPIHHAGKDGSRGLRGSSAIHGAVDATLRIERLGDDKVVVRNEDQKDGEPASDMVFAMEKVLVGLRSSLVPVLIEGEGGKVTQAPSRLGADAKAALLALKVALATDGRRYDREDLPVSVPVVLLERWRAEFYTRSPAEKTDTKSKAFRRGSGELIRAGIAMVLADHAWIVRDE